jgi:alginate O-acetyltransferase complex protein AlgI
MLFNSFIFFIFLGVVLPVFYLLPNKRSKNLFLLLASYFFYGYWDWRFCSLLAISSIIDYYVAIEIDKREDPIKRKNLLYVSLISNLGMLAFFKYFNFFVDSFQVMSAKFGMHVDYLHLNIILPVGISFYTFQTLSYTIDVYKRELKASTNFIDFSLFVSFFPQLVAGPIERATNLLPQVQKDFKATREQVKQGVVLIVIGLFRKVMIGDTTGRFVDHIFGNLEQYKSVEILAGLILFSVQIYADFSGYSHIARGTSKLLGIELMKNFEQPYLSKNITEFWRRWHISLSTWLKDYLYIALGGNKKGNTRTYINLMLTMLLGGLWHGASWNFVIWGGLHGMYLAVHKKMLGNKKVHASRIESLSIQNIVSIVITFLLVVFTWLFFRSTSWDSTQLFFSKIFNWESSEYAGLFISIAGAYLFVTIMFDIFEYYAGKHTYILNIKSVGIRAGILSAMLLVTLIYMFQAEPAPFIYFQF